MCSAWLKGLAVWLLVVLGGWQSTALAAVSAEYSSPELVARLLSSVDQVGPDQSRVRGGLQLQLAEGWKAYWRNPGEVGLPPRLDWQGSANLQAATLSWPAPKRFQAFDIENYGYEGDVVLPLDFELSQAGAPTSLRADLWLLVCRELCIPVEAELTLELPSGAGTIDPEPAQLIDRFRAQVPDDGTVSALEIAQIAWANPAQDAVLIEATSPIAFSDPQVFLETADPASWGAPEIRAQTAGHVIVELPLLSGELATGQPLDVTLVDGVRAMTAVAVPLGAVGVIEPAAGLAIWPFLLLALLGGLVLNVMPCVLPVLALKLGAVIDQRAQGHQEIRRGFLITALGIVAAMMVIAGATIAARSAGLAVGWGLQFQNPYFLAFMTLVVALFAANLFELLNPTLPSGLATSLAGAGGRQGWQGQFATGAFATLLATPCSAPFLGTAVGFALSGSNLDIGLIFMALGLGLALPYLLVAVWPSAVGWLPKPGQWMNKVRMVMGLALIATACWLLSVLWNTIGIVAVVALTVLIVGVIAVLGPFGLRGLIGRLPANTIASTLAILALATPLIGVDGQARTRTLAADWVQFNEANISQLVATGHTVFVDVTADWCITCKANKALVVDRAPIADRLKGEKMVAMQADWTSPDPAIARYLQGFGRYGIPFNIVYGPAAPQGIVLPELLTTEWVQTALDQASNAL